MLYINTVLVKYIIHELTKWTGIISDELNDSPTRHVSVAVEFTILEQNSNTSGDSIDVNRITGGTINEVVTVSEDGLEELVEHSVS